MDLLVSLLKIASVHRVDKFIFHRISMLNIFSGHESEIDLSSCGFILFLQLIH